jgi:hypothetical protein
VTTEYQPPKGGLREIVSRFFYAQNRKENRMQNLKRNKSINFRVTPEEYDMIRKRQRQTGIINLRQYLLKQAVDGRVIHIELDSVHECCRLLGNVSNSINQIAKRVNSTDNVYATDNDDIKARQEEIRGQQKEILRKLDKVLDAMK